MTAAMGTLREDMAYASRCDATTLILGGRGAETEVIARRIHAASNRRHRPFIAVPGAAVTELLLEQAPDGTLFLDAIEQAPPRVQGLLATFLGEGPDVRVIAGTSSDLYGAVTAGAFRDDLYYRLNVIQLRL